MSKANGSFDQSGNFQMELTSFIGNGPTGVVHGKRSAKGGVDAILQGSGCANAEIRGIELKNLNSVPTASSMGYKNG